MIMAKPAHTMPKMRAEKLRGAPAGRGPSAPGRRTGADGVGWAWRGLTFSDAGVEQDAPGEPHGRRQGQRILFLLLTVHLEPAEGAAGCRGRAGEGGQGSPPRRPPALPASQVEVSGPPAALT